MCHCVNMEQRDVTNTSLAFGRIEANGFSDLLGLCHSDFKLFIVMQDNVTFDQLQFQRCLVRMVGRTGQTGQCMKEMPVYFDCLDENHTFKT